MSDRIATDYGQFEEVKVLGQGAFGRASLMRRDGDNELFVLKRLFAGNMPEKEKQDFDKEVRLLKQLGERQHPNVIKYYGSFENNGELCILTDYAEGGDLSKYMNDYRKCETKDETVSGLPQDEVVDLFAQLLSAMKLLHEFRILHRDLKPGNIFVSQKFNLRRLQLGDLGISRQLGSGTDFANTTVGTPYYFSPEVCGGKPYDTKSDVWSLGCILYEMMMMRRPFNGENLNSVIFAIARRKFEKIPESCGYDPALVDVVDRMMAKNPDDRPSVEDLLATVPILGNAEKVFYEELDSLGGLEEMSPAVHTASRPRPPRPWSASTSSSSFTRGDPLGNSQTQSLAGSVAGLTFTPPVWGSEGTGGYEWGLGNPKPREFQALIEKVNPVVQPAKVESVTVGGNHMLALVEGGELWSWMYHVHADVEPCVLGQGERARDIKEPTIISGLAGMYIRSVACGKQHSLALTSGGKVLAWGNGDEGRLGLGDEDERASPCEVGGALAGEVVNRVACGADFSAAVSESGHVYTWGKGEDSQLGHLDPDDDWEPLDDDALEPVQVVVQPGTKMAGQVIKEVSCGDTFTAVVSKDGLLFTWGDNDHGQLGREDTVLVTNKESGEKEEKNVRRVPGFVARVKAHKVVSVSCGAEHMAVLGEDGAVLTWGNNEYGQVGNGVVKGKPLKVPPTWEVDGYKAPKQLACGAMVTMVLTEDGRVYSWGHKNGTGHESEKSVKEPRLVAALLEHAVSRIGVAHVSTPGLDSMDEASAGKAVAIIQGTAAFQADPGETM